MAAILGTWYHDQIVSVVVASTRSPRDVVRARGEAALRRILVAGGATAEWRDLQLMLDEHGYQVVAADNAAAARRELRGERYDCVVCDAELVEAVLSIDGDATVVGVGGGEDVGAYDALALPLTQTQLGSVLRRVAERAALRRELRELRVRSSPPAQVIGAELGMIGDSEPMQRVLEEIRKIAPYKTSVLITGESGTGKELVAMALHSQGPRAGGPFVAVNCGAIPGSLLESELFGHVRGAFTDAVRDKRGIFAEASGGSLFLDEIGELPMELQVKLLRALQEEEIRPVGGSHAIPIDVRIIAATVRDLDQEVARGRFRKDLFYRLNVLPLHLPPLRERAEDIPALVEHFVRDYARKHAVAGMRVRGATPEAIDQLGRYSWPGNIRELENAVERAMVLCEGEYLTPALFSERIRAGSAAAATPAAGELSIKKSARALERQLIARALAKTGGNRTAASKLLEISHRALLYKIKEYGL
jgi:two-component system response regulator AtoC